MLLQVLLRLDVSLAVNLLLRHFLTVDFNVPALLPVAQHEGQAACADVLTLTEHAGFFAGEHLGKQVEQVLRATMITLLATILLPLDGLPEELHLAPKVIAQGPSDEVLRRPSDFAQRMFRSVTLLCINCS